MLPFIPNRHNSAFALVKFPKPVNSPNPLSFIFTHTKAQVEYLNPQAFITSRASGKQGKVAHKNKAQLLSDTDDIGSLQIVSVFITS